MVGGKDVDQGQALVVRHAGAGQVGNEVLQPLLIYDVLEALLLGADAIHPDHPNQGQPGDRASTSKVNRRV